MQELRKAVATLALFALTALLLAPLAFADPIAASVTASPVAIPAGGTTTLTVLVGGLLDPDCTTGFGSYSGTITVTKPDLTTNTAAVGSTPCGTSVAKVYPTDFTAGASTSQDGSYGVVWAGTGGPTPTAFSVNTHFRVPEFAVPTILVAALALAGLSVLRKRAGRPSASTTGL